jgi:hypothetical protein
VGGDAAMTGQAVNITATGATSRLVVERSLFIQPGNAAVITGSTTGRVVIRDCDFVVTAPTYNAGVISTSDGLSVHDCRFDASSVTAGAAKYISFAPGAGWGGCVFTGNRFAENLTITTGLICLYNSLAIPNFDCSEYGNTFGDAFVNPYAITPYGYATDGYAGAFSFIGPMAHGSRIGRIEYWAPTNGQALVISPKQFGETVLHCGAGVASVSLTTDKGASGDRWLLVITNNVGGNVVVTVGGNVALDGAAATVTVATTATQVLEFAWVPSIVTTNAALWRQVNKQAIT